MQQLPAFNHPDLLIGCDGASDAGAFRLRDDLIILQSLDFFPPLVDDPFLFGQIAAANSLSDIYAMGGKPQTALNIVAFPDDQLELSILNKILAGGAERVQAAGAVIAGGHSVRDTEIKYGLSVTGTVTPENLITNRSAHVGDCLVLTKSLGTGFVTTAFKKNRCPDDVLETATESMTKLNQGASQAAQTWAASAATDITGFGLAGHATEMATASGVQIVIELDALPILPGVAALISQGHHTRANATNRNGIESSMRIEGDPDPVDMDIVFDPQTSGGLLVSIAASQADAFIASCKQAGAESTAVIGEVRRRAAESQDPFLILRG